MTLYRLKDNYIYVTKSLTADEIKIYYNRGFGTRLLTLYNVNCNEFLVKSLYELFVVKNVRESYSFDKYSLFEILPEKRMCNENVEYAISDRHSIYYRKDNLDKYDIFYDRNDKYKDKEYYKISKRNSKKIFI